MCLPAMAGSVRSSQRLYLDSVLASVRQEFELFDKCISKEQLLGRVVRRKDVPDCTVYDGWFLDVDSITWILDQSSVASLLTPGRTSTLETLLMTRPRGSGPLIHPDVPEEKQKELLDTFCCISPAEMYGARVGCSLPV